jgi:RHS repeat-associated protein
MTYSAANRLATYNGQAVQFDADGNLVFGPLAGGIANFRFDSHNRLIQAGETTYRYDAENQRLGVNQTSYVVNSQPALSQVLVKDENGVKTFYVYGLGLLGDEKDGEYRSYHFDYRGSTVALTDQTGKVVERFQYGPYGELVKGDTAVTPFLFNGRYGVMTEGNGLYYMRARFYNPEIKRFVNQDVLFGRVSEGQTLNRYAFVTGQPVSLVDPFGLEGYEITDEQRELAEAGKVIEFWKSRWQCHDPVAKTALTGWGHGDLVDANWFQKLSAKYTWWALSGYISEHNLLVSMEEIGRQLARAHVRAVDIDNVGILYLLSPHQVAYYHHMVFGKYGIPPYLFGGTLAGIYIPGLFGEENLLFGIYEPVPTGWSPVLIDADVYSDLWCENCDSLP